MTNKAQSTQFEPNIPSDMDFTALPLMEMASTLRTLGQELLRNLLHSKRQLDWLKLFPLQQAQILVQPRIWEMSCHQHITCVGRLLRHALLPSLENDSLQHRGSDGLRALTGKVAWPNLGLSYKVTVAQAIAGKLSDHAWRARILGRLELDFDGLPPRYMPDDLWPVVSEFAWRDLDFQHWVAAQVRSYFRPRVLFMLGDMPVATLSPRTFWVLIALASLEMQTARPWASPNQRMVQKAIKLLLTPFIGFTQESLNRRMVRKAIKRLQNEGQRQALATGWAGFWDQWILSEALRHWPDAFNKLDSQLCDALLALPLLAITSPAALLQSYSERKDKASQPPVKLAAPNWKKDMPGWFQSLYKPLKSKRRNS